MKIGALLLAGMAAAIDINVDDQSGFSSRLHSARTPLTSADSIIAATKIASKKLRALYPDKESWFVAGEFGEIDGDPTKGYYWWEGGAAMGVRFVSSASP